MSIDVEGTKTEVGNYFVSNYPPFSQWSPEFIGEAKAALNEPARVGDPLGLYIHVPFCRKRCEFCYFKVYTDKNAREIERYVSALDREMQLYSRMPAMAGRRVRYAYFGGGTPSYLSERQLHSLVERLDKSVSWAEAEEVTFECEPGTLKKGKLQTIKEIGVTRLSLGVENFNDEILKSNGRAHLSPEIAQAYEWAREVDFDQINIDLIAGMVGETDANWTDCVRRALEMRPDSLTVYQMELPYNTVISREMIEEGKASPIADWATKRRWVREAQEAFAAAGYRVASAYAMATTEKPTRFIYTDGLWRGGDLVALGVASFGHFGGVHMQNEHNFKEYVERLERGELPLYRALRPTPHQSLVREMVLQLKTGRIEIEYFRDKFGADIIEVFGDEFARLIDRGMMERRNGAIEVTPEGLLRVDSLLWGFFEPELRDVRYA
jgi:oxygen-independent coproporphyrinogen-3 oxidase